MSDNPAICSQKALTNAPRRAIIWGVDVDPRDTRPMLCDWADMVYQNLLPQDLGKKLRGTRP